ncbi:MAG: ASCH domain-containing protein [Phycisphaerae bacterium]
MLKKHLVDLVRDGKKRQTLRFWTRPIVSEGQVSYTPGLGRMLIKRIDLIRDISELTEIDAQADGFRDLPELLAELHRIYPVIPPVGKKLYRIIFEWPVPDSHAKLRKSTGPHRRSGNEKSRRAQRDKQTAMKAANSDGKIRKRSGKATGGQASKEFKAEENAALPRPPTRTEMFQLRDWILNHSKG